MSDNSRHPSTRSRTWLVALGAAVAVVIVVIVATVSVGSGRHRSAAGSSGVAPGPSGQPSPSEPSSPTPSDPNATTVVATATPLASPTGPMPTAPDGGFYLCQGDPGMATCGDATGMPIRQLGIPMLAPGDATYNLRDGYLYYRELLSNAHGSVERISRVALTGGTAQIVVQGPDSLNETDVSFGSPTSSPDGNFLAYGQMTLAFNVPGGPTQIASPGAEAVGPSNGPPGAPTTTRLVQIKVQNLHNLKAPPVIVPLSLMSSDIAADPLLGWSADSRQLFLIGPGHKVDSLAIGADGIATRVATVFDPAAVAPGCQISQTLLSASGDFFVVASCASTIEAFKVHNGKAERFGSLVNTAGWYVDTAQLDTTGRVLEVTWDAPPNSPQCVEVGGSARIIDGVPTAVQIQTTPGCIYNDGSAAIASSP
jgi:hypothetical protein